MQIHYYFHQLNLKIQLSALKFSSIYWSVFEDHIHLILKDFEIFTKILERDYLWASLHLFICFFLTASSYLKIIYLSQVLSIRKSGEISWFSKIQEKSYNQADGKFHLSKGKVTYRYLLLYKEINYMYIIYEMITYSVYLSVCLCMFDTVITVCQGWYKNILVFHLLIAARVLLDGCTNNYCKVSPFL